VVNNAMLYEVPMFTCIVVFTFHSVSFACNLNCEINKIKILISVLAALTLYLSFHLIRVCQSMIYSQSCLIQLINLLGLFLNDTADRKADIFI